MKELDKALPIQKNSWTFLELLIRLHNYFAIKSEVFGFPSQSLTLTRTFQDDSLSYDISMQTHGIAQTQSPNAVQQDFRHKSTHRNTIERPKSYSVLTLKS